MSEIGLSDNINNNRANNDLKNKLVKLKQRIKDFFANPKKRLIFMVFAGLILITLVSTGFYLMSHDKTQGFIPKLIPVATEEKKELFPAVLDGVMTDKDSANRHPLAIIVENHPDARPQAGLDKASVVYEALAEGGITRFLALFGTQETEKVGPVRSARTYLVDWAHGYDAYLAHVGGNIDALDKIPKDKIYDLDQFKYSSPYWRERSSGLATEHTMYTSTTKLRETAAQNKYSTANNFNIYKFKDDPEKSTLPASQTITVNFSSPEFQVKYVYDQSTNSYKRSLAGKPHTDQITKDQLNPKNVVVMTVKKEPTVTRINEIGYNMTTIGQGAAKIYIEGKEIKGIWKKESATSRELFYDENGKEIVFDRGQLWICVIPPDGSVKAE